MKAPQKYFNACSTGKAALVKEFLDDGISVESRDGYNLTGLIWAGRKGRIEVAQLLLENGADIDAGDNRNRTAIFHAVTYNRNEFIEFMADVGANLNIVDCHGWTPLDAVNTKPSKKDKETTALLVRLGATPKAHVNRT